MTKEERKAEAEAIRKLLPSAPRERVRIAFMGSTYDSIDAVFKSELLPNGETGKKERVVAVRCGWCGEKSLFPYVKIERPAGCCHAAMMNMPADPYGFEQANELIYTGKTYRCPVCRESSRAVSFFRTNNRVIAHSKTYRLEFHAIRGHLAMVEWKMEKWLNREGHESYCDQRERATWQVDGVMYNASGYETYGYANMSREPADEWVMLSRYGGAGGWRQYAIDYDAEDLTGTEEWNDGFIRYMGGDSRRWLCPGNYLQIWAKYHNFENLAKWAPLEYVDDLVSMYDCPTTPLTRAKTCLNFKKVRPHEILGVEKEDALRFFEMTLHSETIYLFREAKKNGVRLGDEELKRINYRVKDFIRFWSEARKVVEVPLPFVQTLRYWNKLLPGDRGSILIDYWRMVQQVEGRIAPEVMFPKDVRRAHDRIMERQRAKADAKKNEGIRKTAAKVEKYVFSDQETGLCIRPARSVAELVKEGKELSHCVASYAGHVAAGDTSILFVRKIEAPDVPYFTLEWKGKKIVQDHGKGNKLQTPDVMAFEKKWLAHVKKVDSRRKKDGKRDHASAVSA